MPIWIHPDQVDITSIMGVVPEWGEGGLQLRGVWRWLLALLLWPYNWLY